MEGTVRCYHTEMSAPVLMNIFEGVRVKARSESSYFDITHYLLADRPWVVRELS